MKLLLAALLSAGTVAASYGALVELYRTAHAHLLTIESHRDKGLEQAARLQWQLDDLPGNPTVEQLVEHGYLAPSYLTRERVGDPIALPETLPEEPQQ
jgi:proline dehydrogenase